MSSALPHNPRLGILFRLAAMISFAAMAAMVKLGATAGVGTVELIFFRNLFALLPILGLVLFTGSPAMLATRRPGAHLLRSGIGLFSMLFTFLGMAHLPLGTATAIGFSMPLFATLLSALILGEAVGRHRWAAVAIGFIGVLILIRPNTRAAFGIATLFPLLGAFGTAMVAITIRQIAATENGIAIAFWFTVVATSVSGMLLPFTWTPLPAGLWPSLVALGFFGGIAQMFMSLSLRLAPVSTLVPFDYTQILFIGVLAYLLFGERPSAGTIAGGIVIVGSGLYIFYRETVRRRPVSPVANADELP